MKLLLDTHIWIWSLLEKNRLKPRTTRALRDTANELWLSPISVWELCVLSDKGRLKLDDDVDVWLAKAMIAAPMREAPLTSEIVVESRSVELPHRDPADRFITATARTLGLTLVTADARIIDSRAVEVLANR